MVYHVQGKYHDDEVSVVFESDADALNWCQKQVGTVEEILYCYRMEENRVEKVIYEV